MGWAWELAEVERRHAALARAGLFDGDDDQELVARCRRCGHERTVYTDVVDVAVDELLGAGWGFVATSTRASYPWACPDCP